MGTQQYLAPPPANQDGLAGTDPNITGNHCVPTTSSAVSFGQDFVTQTPTQQTPYSAVSSFNLPATADSTLLTPTSNSASPPMQHRSAAKMMRSYQSSPTSASQQPSPPSTTSMFWPSQVSTSLSAASSPMTVQASVDGNAFAGMQGYMRQDDPPPIITPFLGHYSVSETDNSADRSPVLPGHGGISSYGGAIFVSVAGEPSSPMAVAQHQHHHAQHHGHHGHHAHHANQAHHHHQHQQHHGMHPMSLPMQLQSHHGQHRPRAPILSEPNPLDFKARQAASSALMAGHRGITGEGKVTKQRASRARPKRTAAGSSRRAGSKSGSTGSSPKDLAALPTGVSRGGSASPISGGGDVLRAVSGNDGGGVDFSPELIPLEVAGDTPEKLKYLIELRYKFQDTKGKGMWESIQEHWADRYEPKERAALQMDVNRAVYKYAKWPQSEDDALLQAYQEDEATKMTRIAAAMKLKGGGRYWDWKEKNVTKRLVELGLEEVATEPATGNVSSRKRRKTITGNTSSTPTNTADDIMISPPPNQRRPLPVAAATPQRMPSELEDVLFEAMVKDELAEAAADGGGNAMTGLQMTSPVLQQQQEQQQHKRKSSTISEAASESERLARQVCAQIMQKQAGHRRSM